MSEQDPGQRVSYTRASNEKSLEKAIEAAKRLGALEMATFIPKTLESSVPREFWAATVRYVLGLSNQEDIKNIPIIAAEHLMGITCENADEAYYLLNLASATSIFKQFFDDTDEETEDLSFEQSSLDKAQELLGASLIAYRMTTSANDFRKYVLPKRYTAKRVGRMNNLELQMEQNFRKPEYQSKIKFLATIR